MLITRGFGTGTGAGPGEYIYVPITDPIVRTNTFGHKTLSSDNKLPSFTSDDNTVNPPEVTTDTVKTNLDLDKLQPKITTNIPKF